jgi:signal transduction histidine kinase
MTTNMITKERPDATPESADPAGTLRVLVVEDNADDSELILRELRTAGFELTSQVVRSPDEFRQALRPMVPDVVLADFNLGMWSGMEALEILRTEELDIPLILVSGAIGDLNAVEYIKQGATDYVLKDALPRLPAAVRRALYDRRLRETKRFADRQLQLKVEELARSNHDLEQFAYVASHDLQEPLRMVAAYTQLLAEKYRGKLDEQADKYIRYAVDGSVRMQTLIQDLLAFSRAGREETGFQLTDCRSIVQHALGNLEAAIKESGAKVICNELPSLVVNPGQLKQVFQNLVANAIKFHGPEPPVILIGAERVEKEWTFSVSDNGIGIAPDDLEVIFAVFQRLHTRTEYEGNGIGLAICKKIIERHGGRIFASSEAGSGSTFIFTLPVREQGSAG